MIRSKQSKKGIKAILNRLAMIILAFLPAVFYSAFVYASLANGAPYNLVDRHYLLNSFSNYYFTMQIVGGLLSIFCAVILGVFYILGFKKIKKDGLVLDRSILVFAMAMLVFQLAYIIYFMIFQISEPVVAYPRISGRLEWSILPILDRVLRCLWAALTVSGLYLIVDYCSNHKQRLADWLELLRQILIVSIPILICVVTHIVATAKGVPYNESCCAIVLPDPSEQTVVWFLMWEISGAVLAFLSNIILFVSKLKSHAKNKGSTKAIIDLLCINILIGEIIALFLYVLIVCNPGMARDRYRAGYFYELLGFDELPFYYSRWNECLFYTVFFLPAATIISSVRAAMLMHKKNRHHNN